MQGKSDHFCIQSILEADGPHYYQLLCDQTVKQRKAKNILALSQLCTEEKNPYRDLAQAALYQQDALDR